MREVLRSADMGRPGWAKRPCVGRWQPQKIVTLAKRFPACFSMRSVPPFRLSSPSGSSCSSCLRGKPRPSSTTATKWSSEEPRPVRRPVLDVHEVQELDTYYYLGGLELAAFTGRTADKDLEEIEKLFDYKPRRPHPVHHLQQAQRGQADQHRHGDRRDRQQQHRRRHPIVGNKVFLYFTGNHEEFHRQIRAGIARC